MSTESYSADSKDVTVDDSESVKTAGADETGGEGSAVDLPLDQVFEILKNRRRRIVLRYLETHEETVTLGELAEKVAAVENDTTVTKVTSRERKCAYVGLYQCHLPKMDDMDIVEFNQDRGRIAMGPNADRLEQYLEWGETTTRPWPLYYGAVGTMRLALVGVSALLTVTGLTAVVAAVSLLAVVGVAVAHDTTGTGESTVRSIAE